MAPKPTKPIGESLPKYPNGRLADYLGLPSVWSGSTWREPEEAHKDYFNMFPLLAYHKIILDWYSPQRWVEDFNANGSENDTLIQLKKCCNSSKSHLVVIS